MSAQASRTQAEAIVHPGSRHMACKAQSKVWSIACLGAEGQI